MQPLATLFREAQFFAHAAHNLVSGPQFFADHDFLGGLYETYEAAYDTLVERSIGLGKPIDPLSVTLKAAEKADERTVSNKTIFSELLQLEEAIRDEIDSQLSFDVSHGVSNLLEGMADESEARTYKIQQRAK